MKQITITLAILFVTLLANAQDQTTNSSGEIGTLFGRNKVSKPGWFIGLDNGYTKFGSRDIHMSGITVALIANHNFTIGISGSGWTNRNSTYYAYVTDTCGAYLEGGFGKLLLEFTPNPKSPVHFTFPVFLGVGGASYVTDKEWYEWDGCEWDTHHKVIDADAFFTFEPGVRLEVNVFRFMRLNAGVSYRFVNGLELIHTSASMMNNYSATFGVKFGRFQVHEPGK
jgi:hypothetical protein